MKTSRDWDRGCGVTRLQPPILPFRPAFPVPWDQGRLPSETKKYFTHIYLRTRSAAPVGCRKHISKVVRIQSISSLSALQQVQASEPPALVGAIRASPSTDPRCDGIDQRCCALFLCCITAAGLYTASSQTFFWISGPLMSNAPLSGLEARAGACICFCTLCDC